ncbi:MAG TPA: ABC transporter substrate-binding protein [Blastocatellia bacterium]|nr:ABC transporter substrate-binding protein [Blastocatellia bacterium]
MAKYAEVKKALIDACWPRRISRSSESADSIRFPRFNFANSFLLYLAILALVALLEHLFGILPSPPPQVDITNVLRVSVALRLDDKENQSVHSLNSGIEVARILFLRRNPGINIDLDRLAYDNVENLRAMARRIIDSGTPAVIGGEWSSEALELGSILKESSVVFVTPTASNPKVTEDRPYIFRICLPDDVVASRLAFYTLDKLKPKTLAVVHDTASPYSDYLSQKYVDTVMGQLNRRRANERPVVIQEKFNPATAPESRSMNYEAVDFRPMIEKFKRQNVTHVTLLSYSSDLIPFLKQANEADFHPVYIGGDGWGAPSRLYKTAADQGVDLTHFQAYRHFYWDESKNTTLAQEFGSEFEKLYKVPPEGLDAIGFDAAWVLFTAMSKADYPRSGDKIRREMLQLESMSLLTYDHFQFEQNNGLGNMPIFKLTGSGSTLVDSIR